jgi:hypothetical protein
VHNPILYQMSDFTVSNFILIALMLKLAWAAPMIENIAGPSPPEKPTGKILLGKDSL